LICGLKHKPVFPEKCLFIEIFPPQWYYNQIDTFKLDVKWQTQADESPEMPLKVREFMYYGKTLYIF
jgi:hypothetical protein